MKPHAEASFRHVRGPLRHPREGTRGPRFKSGRPDLKRLSRPLLVAAALVAAAFVSGLAWRAIVDSSARSGTVAVPDVRELELDEAYVRLQSANLRAATVGTVPYAYNVSLPVVLQQTPPPGTDAPSGSTVTLTRLLAGPRGLLPAMTEKVVVPNVSGMRLDMALEIIQARSHLGLEPLTWQTRLPSSDGSDADSLLASYCVTSQQPRPGKPVAQAKMETGPGGVVNGTVPPGLTLTTRSC